MRSRDYDRHVISWSALSVYQSGPVKGFQYPWYLGKQLTGYTKFLFEASIRTFINITCLSPHTSRLRNLIKNSYQVPFFDLLSTHVITQIVLQLTSAHSYGARGRVGRNQNVTGFEAILRISVAKLTIGFFWIWGTAWKFGSFCRLFFWRVCEVGVNCIKKERVDNMRQELLYEVKRLWSACNLLINFISLSIRPC